MTPEHVQMLCDAIDEGGRIVFAVFLAIGGATIAGIVSILFLCYLLQGIWRFLTTGRWNSVIVSAERKAMR